MKISDNGLELVKSFEGYLTRQSDGSCKAYKCPAGVWTCGWGCTEGVTPNTLWTEAEATAALRSEMDKHEAAVLRLVKVPITQSQFDALVSFSYNCGSTALAKSTLLRHLNSGDPVRAASHFADYKRAGGKVLAGLVRRRAAEAGLFMRGVDTDAPMVQHVDSEKSKMTPAEAVGKIAAPVGGVVAVGSQALPNLPSPPAEIAVKATEWQGFAEQLGGMGLWIVSHPLQAAFVGLVFAGVTFGLPLLQRRDA
jgi:lysozyme